MRPCHHGWRCARHMRLGGVDGQTAVHSGPSKRTFEAMQPDWMLRLTSGFLQNSSCTLPDTPAPPARAQDGRKARTGSACITSWRKVRRNSYSYKVGLLSPRACPSFSGRETAGPTAHTLAERGRRHTLMAETDEKALRDLRAARCFRSGGSAMTRARGRAADGRASV